MPINKDIDYSKAHKEIDLAIESSVHETPAPITEIYESLGEQYERSLIYRRFLLAWKRRGKRWVRREDEE